MKSQVLVEASSLKVLATAHAKGPKHDYALFKETAPRCKPEVWYVADSGYQGLVSRHPQTCLPCKKPKGGELSPQQKAHNRALGRFRIAIEHVVRTFKVWHILKETYRDHSRTKRSRSRDPMLAQTLRTALQPYRRAYQRQP